MSSDPDSLMNETMLRASYEMDLIATSRLDMNLFKKKLALARAVLSLQAMAEGMPETWMSTVKECSTMWWDRITIYIL